MDMLNDDLGVISSMSASICARQKVNSRGLVRDWLGRLMVAFLQDATHQSATGHLFAGTTRLDEFLKASPSALAVAVEKRTTA
eukprot:1036981-Pyramimonas_sp.AAC.1